MTIITAAKQAAEALSMAEALLEQAGSGYGFARPSDPHRFSPDIAECSAEEIANHSSACGAFDKGAQIPQGSWGIGCYAGEVPKEITDALDGLRKAIAQAERRPQPSHRFMAVGMVNEQNEIDWIEGITDDQAPIGSILYAKEQA